jgi:phage terminase large subunit-like protein
MSDHLRQLGEDYLAWADHYGIPLFTWQRTAFGEATKREAGHFVHRLAGISVPRGDGKSYGAATVGAWVLQHHAQPVTILSEALDYEGARICLDHGRAVFKRHPDLRQGVEFLADEIRIPSTGSRWLIRSREHTASRGLHPNVILFDECGWHKDEELYSSLLAAQASVLDPLMLVVSTVGATKSGPLWRIKQLWEQQQAAA